MYFACVCACVRACARVCTCLCACARACVCVCACVCACVRAHRRSDLTLLLRTSPSFAILASTLLAGHGPLRPLCQWPVSDMHSVLESLRPETPPALAVTVTVLLFYHGLLGPGF